MQAPDVSFIMAARNAQNCIAAALASARAQRDATTEVVVVVDQSIDRTLEAARACAVADEMVRVIDSGRHLGASAARNLAIENARGQWLAVLDADDLIAQDRTHKLLAVARRTGADVVADNIMRFRDNEPAYRRTTDIAGTARQISIADWIAGNLMLRGRRNLGYLKPMVRADFIDRHAIHYDPRLRIGEDYILMLQLLVAGAKVMFLDDPMYFYRESAGSLSRTLAEADVYSLVSAQSDIAEKLADDQRAELSHLLRTYQRHANGLANYGRLKAGLKARQWRRVGRLIAKHPTTLAAAGAVGANWIGRIVRPR